MSSELTIKAEKRDNNGSGSGSRKQVIEIKPDPDDIPTVDIEEEHIERETRSAAPSVETSSGTAASGGGDAQNIPAESRAKLEFCIQLVSNAIKYMQAEDCGLYIRRSYYYMKLGNLDKAKEDGLKAVELGPASPAARGQLASVYVELKKLSEAEAVLTKDLPAALTGNPKSYDQLKQIRFRLRRQTLIEKFNIPAKDAEHLADLTLLDAIKKYTDT